MVEDKKKIILPPLNKKNKSVLTPNTQIGSTKTSPLAKQVSSDENDKDANMLDDLFDELECNENEEISIETSVNQINKLKEDLDEIFSEDEKEESLKNDIESNLSSLKNIDKRVQNLDERTHAFKDKLKNIYEKQQSQVIDLENISFVSKLQLRKKQSRDNQTQTL